MLLVASFIAKLIGAEWPWVITATAGVAALAGLLGQVVAPLREHRAARAQAAASFRAVLYGDP